MKFIIDSNSYEIAEKQASEDVIALMSKEMNRNLFVKREAGILLEVTDQETDFEEWSRTFDEDQIRDLKDALTLLECFGIAKCRESERDRVPEVRAAGEKDYRKIADFIQKHKDDTFGFMPSGDEEFYSEDTIRARQFMNLEYCFFTEKDGQVRSLIIMAMPQAETFSTAVRICGIRFSTDLDSTECEELLAKMVERTVASFSDDYTKLRYLEWTGSHDRLTDCLRRLGFKKICTLKQETYDASDVTVYDLKIR